MPRKQKGPGQEPQDLPPGFGPSPGQAQQAAPAPAAMLPPGGRGPAGGPAMSAHPGRGRGGAPPGRGYAPPGLGRGGPRPPAPGPSYGGPPPPMPQGAWPGLGGAPAAGPPGVPMPPPAAAAAPLPPQAPAPGGPPPPAPQTLAAQPEGAALISPRLNAPETAPAEPARLQLTYTPQRALRPDYGKAGRRVPVRANWFKVECQLDEAYHYDVDIKGVRREEAPERAPPKAGAVLRPLPADVSRAAINAVAAMLRWPQGQWAFDGRKNMYTPFLQLVPNHQLVQQVEVTVEDDPRPRQLEVTIRRVATIPISALKEFMQGRDSELAYHAIQALDVVLKHRMLFNRESLYVGRAFYFHDRNVQSIGEGAEVWLGYQQSLRPCQSGLALNMGTAATAMLEAMPLIDFMYNKIGDVRGPLSPHQRRTLQKAVFGVKIKTTHNGFKKAIRSLTRGGPYEETFMNEAAGKTMTIAQYFKEQYNIVLKYRDYPCIAVGNGRVVLPPEVCNIVPGQRRTKLTENQTAGMIKVAAQRPDDKARNIEALVGQKAAFHQDPAMQAFGLRVNNRMMEVNARVLPQPTLAYASPPNFDPKDGGAWNLRDVRFLVGSQLPSWGVVCFGDPRRCGFDLEQAGGQHGPTFMKEFVDMLNKCGVATPRTFPPVVFAPRNPNVLSVMQQAASKAQQAFKQPPRLLLAVLPDTGAALYREVKQASDSALGVPSQCIVARKAGIGAPPRGRAQYCANVAMKVNTKLGGVNVKLQDRPQSQLPILGSKPFMIFGADVTHPMGGEDMPSVAAVVGSVDATATKYATRVSMQAGRQEIIVDLKHMVKELLGDFYAATKGMRPERIVFYRDGVSEGQFREVYYREYAALREACREMGDPSSDYAPPITFVIVQKRHNTRLFPQERDTRNRDRSGNVMPGTVVDTDICHPFEFDFYLNSHSGIQGTSRPTHYHVIVDENKFSADGMQTLTYRLCYLFCRCTRSISVCPPAQYAHLAAFRGRIMCRGGDSDQGSVASGGQAVEFLPINSSLNRSMFYV